MFSKNYSIALAFTVVCIAIASPSAIEAKSLLDLENIPLLPSEIITIEGVGRTNADEPAGSETERIQNAKARSTQQVYAIIDHIFTQEESLGLSAVDREARVAVNELFYRTATLPEGCYSGDVVAKKSSSASDQTLWRLKEISKACPNEKLGRGLSDELINATFRALAEASAIHGVDFILSNINHPDPAKKFVFSAEQISDDGRSCFAIKVSFQLGKEKANVKRIDVCRVNART